MQASRNLMRYVTVLEEIDTSSLANLLSAFAVAAKLRLRDEKNFSPTERFLSPEQYEFVSKAINRPLSTLLLITKWCKVNCTKATNAK